MPVQGRHSETSKIQQRQNEKMAKVKTQASSGQNIKKSPSQDRYSKISKRSEKKDVVDLDAEQEDRFGLLALKNVTSQKNKNKAQKDAQKNNRMSAKNNKGKTTESNKKLGNE